MNAVPDCVDITVLSLISLKNWTCGAISEPNVAVAIRHPPPEDSYSSSIDSLISSEDSDSIIISGIFSVWGSDEIETRLNEHDSIS